MPPDLREKPRRPVNSNVMRLRTRPVSAAQEVHWGSDVSSLSFDARGLVVVVAREPLPTGQVKGLRISFPGASALRYLDESELTRYWTSEQFTHGHHVLEVERGGWLDEECQLEGYEFSRREWLIVTGNGCVSVFSSTEPQVDEVLLEPDA
jgi:hypothetical protein